MIKEKESKILDIFNSQNIDISSQIDVSNMADQSMPQNATTRSQISDSNIVNLAVSTFLFWCYISLFVESNILT